jgi:membrane glycosyltransferase
MTRPIRWQLLTGLGGLIAAGTLAWAGAGVPAGWGFAVLPLLAGGVIALTLTGFPIMLGAAARLLGLRGPALRPAEFDGGSRTAILVPIHNEDSARVFAGIRTMRTQVDAAGLHGVELFVLSDTRDPAIAAEEEAEFSALSTVGAPVTYRRRTDNSGRKAGNIAEFCERWGGAFDYMLVLDADSVMGASAIAGMIGLMDANPRAGLIQTVPYAVNRETLHARLSQFAMRLYTPLWAEGAAFWHGSDANYWGHNAIIRIAPFMRHAKLPILPGRAPLGGEILCHDVVEAALLRAQGWETWLVPGLADSFEELPPNMADDAARERRWCQGNLQHMQLVGRAGLRPQGRLHLGSGVLYYLAAPCWVALTALLTVMPRDAALATAHAIGLPVLALFAIPKLCGLIATCADARRSAQFGGRARVAASMAAEQAIGLLTTPGALLSSAAYVVTTLTGKVVRWDAQPRSDRGMCWGEAWSRFGWQATLGAVWGLVLLAREPALFAWAAPIVAGLVASVPLAVWTSRLDLGRATRRLGLFLTEDEVHPSAVLRAYRAATGAGMRPAIAEAWTAAAPRPAQSPPRGEPLETLS